MTKQALLLLSLCCLFWACDAPPDMPRVEHHEENKFSKEEKEVDEPITAESLMRSYFTALEKHKHKDIEEMLLYPTLHFYRKEPQPLVHWKLLHTEELTSEEADSFKIKPNPIKEDLMLKVRVYSLDEYKKYGYEAIYFARESGGHLRLVNRIGGERVVSIWLKYGESLDFEEYEVLQQTDAYYLVQIQPHLLVTVNERTKILDRFEGKEEEGPLSFDGEETILAGEIAKAKLTKNGTFMPIEGEENQK